MSFLTDIANGFTSGLKMFDGNLQSGVNTLLDIGNGFVNGVQSFGDNLQSGVNTLLGSGQDAVIGSSPVIQSSPSAFGVSRSRIKPQTIDYLNADLAKHYGLSRATAYQEALANTSYQRAVADMKAAGLNPSVLFGSGRASGASGVGYVSQPGSGSSSARSYGSRSKSDSKLFSGSTYSAMSMVGGLIGAIATRNPNNFWIGSQIAQGAMGLADAVSRK